ncbi:glutathionylspermidine synthase family protein [Cognatishimia sp. SS12]|uniref:glutathionylspermidine synthase family protein n=1 Tax=Cognatishimia sp. SS12 TaxID=2979465 RepID=UPI00232F11CC|nr:glutathionylspermidine synthase family protein [Cognatishimia sp. SS12]MDC0738892.1 glutathionylspermidine synthase family protein [Cognatishimia sp. SS12]
MQKISLPERPDWRGTAKGLGFTFADMHGEPYWDETSAYQFSLRQIEDDIEDPATELHSLCRELIPDILASEEMMDRLVIPAAHRDYIAASWRDGAPEIYGRFDLVYDGNGPAKMLEYNADTPTSLYESASFQWSWLEEQIAAGVLTPKDDQFNGIHEALVARFAALFPKGTDLHFTAIAGQPEDYATVESMGWAAREAGLGAHYTDLEKIALSEERQFLDDEDRVIATLFKLYPWEDLLRDDYAAHLAAAGCLMLEPAWKALLSNKGILPLLWQKFEGHPNLLPAYFADDTDGCASLGGSYVEKPIFSREGASVRIVEDGQTLDVASDRAYDAHPMIRQAYQPLPIFDGFRPIVGAWVIGETCAGIGIREDRARITQDLSRFKPHFIRD